MLQSGEHCGDFYPGVLPFSQLTVIHLQVGYQQWKSTGIQSPTELLRFDEIVARQFSIHVMAATPDDMSHSDNVCYGNKPPF